jgi:hypothetical protein
MQFELKVVGQDTINQYVEVAAHALYEHKKNLLWTGGEINSISVRKLSWSPYWNI